MWIFTCETLVKNDMDAAAKVSAKVISTKNGQNLATVQLPEMHTLKLENIKVKLVGKVIGNFN